MIKKSIAFILIAALYILTACSNTGGSGVGNVVSPAAKGEAPELTILLSSTEYANMKAEPVLMDYIEDFERQMGVKIRFDKVNGYGRMLDETERAEYMKNLAVKLYTKNGPDLIFTEYFFFHEVLEQEAVEEVSNKIPNISKVYPGLLNEQTYYVPIGMKYYCRGLNSKVLQEIQIPEPEFNWTRNDYFSILDKWISSMDLYFDSNEYANVYVRYVESRIDLRIDNGKLIINIPEAIEGIKQARQLIFNGNYILDKSYRYENYYNMILDENSKEAADGLELYNTNKPTHLRGHLIDGFRAEFVDRQNKKNSNITLPEFSDERPYLNTMGFLVNKDSQHSELVYEFINGLLSDETQMALFESGDYHYYPVNKDIEQAIKEIEARNVKDSNVIKLKEYILQQLNSGVCDTDEDINQDGLSIKNMLYRDLVKYILADKEYSVEELNKELKALVDKYNIWLSE
ncbi:MAG: Bacterial extracellular solute-binding protein [Clostridia bacterium]|nr:Bacterial extracellular solute-binding protein [Clostridia bacterium]